MHVSRCMRRVLGCMSVTAQVAGLLGVELTAAAKDIGLNLEQFEQAHADVSLRVCVCVCAGVGAGVRVCCECMCVCVCVCRARARVCVCV